MLKDTFPPQDQMEFVCIENLVPQGHLLRKIARHIDFTFVWDKCRPLYCADNGRPAVDPVVLFKILLIGYLYGIRSERQLIRDIEVNMAYRWFLGLSLTDKVIDHSTLSQNRARRFSDNTVYQEIFDEIVFLAMRKGLVSGECLYTDSTHLKANANKNKFLRKQVEQNTRSYLSELDQAIQSDRVAHGKKPLSSRDDDPTPPKEIKQSTTDPDSGYMTREGKPQGFFYLDHRTVDNRANIITDVHVTPANVYDSLPYLDRLDEQMRKFGFAPQAVALDAGYNTAAVCHGLRERNLIGVIGYRRPSSGENGFYKRQYRYDPVADSYICPCGQTLRYSTTNRNGYREYRSNPSICKCCPSLLLCTRSRNHQKVLTRHVWEDDKEAIAANRLTPEGKALYKRRKETIERSFADAKELHGYRYARFRGLLRVTAQCLFTAMTQNLKKIAMVLDRRERKGGGGGNASKIGRLGRNIRVFDFTHFFCSSFPRFTYQTG